VRGQQEDGAGDSLACAGGFQVPVYPDPRRLRLCAILLNFACLVGLVTSAVAQTTIAGITLVQSAGKDAGITTSSSLAFTASNTAGNWVAVAIRAGQSGQTFAVSDTQGNTYRTAIQLNETSDGTTVALFYAENIAGGANTITISDSIEEGTLRFAIFEYAGVATASSLDVAASAQGTSDAPNSGDATTTANGDLIIGLISSADGATFETGSEYVIEAQVPAPPSTKLVVQDQRQAAAGPVSAGATLNVSNSWGAIVAAFRAAASVEDMQAPTSPTGLTATATSSRQIDLAWTASTDNVGVTVYLVERCQGAVCTNFAQLGTAASAAYTDSTASASTSYSYRVRAADAAGNLGSFSNTAIATTPGPDSEPPSAPGTLTATVVSGTQVDLSWGAATDNVGITGYRVERCQGAGCSIFVKLATPAGTTFSDTGLTPNTSYSYVALASDAAGNLGPYSNPVSVTTAANIPELVAAYSFNEGSGTTAIDRSGGGNDGAIGAATWTTAGKYGGALSFNGSSAKVVVSDSASLHLTTGVTLEAWVKPSIVDKAWRDVIYKGNDNYYLEATTPTSGRPAAGVTLVSTGNSNTYGTAALSVNTWTHLAETFDGTTVRLYVNGVQSASFPQDGSLVTSTDALEIGGDSIYGQYFQGLIDEIRVFNVARTPTQIQSDMGTPVGSNVPLVNLNAAIVDFGQQAIAVTTGGKDVTIANVGGVPLTIGSIGISGANASDFAQTNTCGSTLGGDNSCTITVTFTPSAAGLRSGLVTIEDDAAGAPHTIALQGTGVTVLVTPALSTLTPGRTQQFKATSSGTISFIWSVDDVDGGSAVSGTITDTGLYSPPASPGSHIVTATTPDRSRSGSATVYVVSYAGTFTFHNDNARTGANLSESVLTTRNVNATRFGKLQSFDIDGEAYASPLYVPAVAVPGQGAHNVVYVATEHNSVYAFDADGLSATPLWHVSFINPAAGVTTVSPTDVGECCDINPQIGITGTPVIDPASGTLYVVAKTREVVGGTTNFLQRLHALDIATGAEKFGGPMVIQATVAGTGAGSSGDQVTFLPLRELQRPALLLNNGIVYIAFGSHGDQQPYHGWVLGYDSMTLHQTFAYNATADGEGAGVWIAGSGPAADTAGNVFFVTGDGTFDANTGGTSFGDSYLKMSSLGSILDYFTPHDQGTLDSGNIDLGAGGIVLLPDQPGTHPHLMVSAGKNGTIDLIDRDDMGHYKAGNDDQIVQTLINIFPFGTPEPGNYSAPVYFNGTVYFSPVADSVQAFTLTNGLFSATPTSRSAEIFAYPGGTLALSASGNTNAILWALERRGNSSGALRAYDAGNLGIELYNSDQAGSRDSLDEVTKFSAPVIANGKVYVASTTKLTIFGLIQ
jgi:chitodextrinase